jgi:AcrR family transcriptional regulator
VTAAPATADPARAAREGEVLDAVLELLVEGVDSLTMSAVAQRASCSKETLYKWFGDRDGLLRAAVRRQASRVDIPPLASDALNAAALRERLERYAASWLAVISSPTSVALNRLAIAHAGSGRSRLGDIVLENGRLEMGRRLKPVLEAGHRAGLLNFPDAEEAFRVFFGLVARDVQIRLLLGDRLTLSAQEIARDAARAAQQFLMLYTTTNRTP